MNIVQTFWSGDKDPLTDSFGWLSPQHNLMSWAFSCLSLRQHYENVILYTDSTGYKIFHEHLQLPYTKIIIQYDNLNCHKDLWAYPKLLTYSIQKSPFVHIDGDVYLPGRLPQEIEAGALITQNAETGTSYYKQMMHWITENTASIPDYLLEEINKDSISSYNAGVIGGNDLEFIKEYCRSAFEFISDNHLSDVENEVVNINYNILFEQILFHALIAKKNKTVSTVIDHPVNDNGYTYNEFCDFYSFHKNPLMHIIGGHKQNERTCELLSRTLLNKYPEYYKRIRDLFPTKHIWTSKHRNKSMLENPVSDWLKNIQQYKDFLDTLLLQWSKLQHEELFEQERHSGNYFSFLNSSESKQAATTIKRNPYLFIYEIPVHWDIYTRKSMKDRISKDFRLDKFDIACLPALLDDKCTEVLINDVCYNILILLQKQKTVGKLLTEIKKSFPTTIRNNHAQLYEIVLPALEYLFYHKLIYID